MARKRELSDDQKIAILAEKPGEYSRLVKHVYRSSFGCQAGAGDMKVVDKMFTKLRRNAQLSDVDRETLAGYYGLLKERRPELGLT